MIISMLEGDIQLSICEYLEWKRHFFWRQNSSGSFYKGADGSRQFRKPPKYAKNGVPDIIVVKDGIFIGLEVKQPKGKQSADQKKFETDLVAAGGVYNIVTSIEDVQALGL